MDEVMMMLRKKLGEMTAQEVSQDAGMAPGGQGASPGAGGQDPAAQGGMPVDPQTGMPIDPATGMPVDPATGMPMDPAAQQQPVTLEELVASGDPLVGLLVEMDKKLDALAGAMKSFQDSAGMQVPASAQLEAQMEAAETPASAPAAPKQASNPRLVDDEAEEEEETLTLGQAGQPGRAGALVLDAKLSSGPERNKELANAIMNRRRS